VLKRRAPHKVQETKTMVQIRTTRKISEIFTIKAHDIEVVGNCKYKY
jgi:hypothetical protein